MSVLLPFMLYLVYHNIAGKSSYIRGGRNETREHDTVGATYIIVGYQNIGRRKQKRESVSFNGWSYFWDQKERISFGKVTIFGGFFILENANAKMKSAN